MHRVREHFISWDSASNTAIPTNGGGVVVSEEVADGLI